MRTLVLPDIHTHYDQAQEIIKKNNHDEVVLVGDYFDEFGDSPLENKKSALWLKDYLHKKNHIALIGNHEFNYMFGRRIDLCSGYSPEKNRAINEVLKYDDWTKLRPYYQTQGWWITHAGITAPLFARNGWDAQTFIETTIRSMERIQTNQDLDTTFQVGYIRGGHYSNGGLNWCHFPDEFKPIPEIKQIFGHTPGKEARQYKTTDNWCIDTQPKLMYFAIIENGTLQVKQSG